MGTTSLRLREMGETRHGEWIGSERCGARTWRRGWAWAVAVAVVLVGLVAGYPAWQCPAPRYTRVVVAPGDTLWRLARVHGHRDRYILSTMHEIRRVNRLSDSRLVPGQALFVPTHGPAHLSWQPGRALARGVR